MRSFEKVVGSIEETRTATGLQVRAHHVVASYATGEKVSDGVMAGLKLEAHEVCPQWNYTIHPRLPAGPSPLNWELILL